MSEVFFGGARGGGKTDGVLGKWALKEQRYGPKFNAIMFRRTTVSSEDAIERSKDIFKPLGGKFNETKLIWRMPNGGRVAFAYLDSIKDAEEYQGRNVTDAWVEEAGQYPDPTPIDRLFGVLRSSAGVPVQLILTANPGGAGQHWIAARYALIPFPTHPKVVTRQLSNGNTHRMAVIPSRITDNRVLLHGDPGYIDRLHLVGSAALVRAWLEGDWSAIEGAFFDKWSSRNVVEPFEIPDDWIKFRSFDWGYAKPFSAGWWAVAGDDYRISARTGEVAQIHARLAVDAQAARQNSVIPRGALVRYREWYGSQPDKPNTGLRLETEPVGRGILERDHKDKITYGVADPSIFSEDGGPARSEIFGRLGLHYRPADNKRIGKNGAMGGWDEMRQRIAGTDGVPMLYVFSSCRDFIRTVPVLQHDPMKAEDLDTASEDHIADECFAAGTMVETIDGPRPIETLTSGLVLTSGDRYAPFAHGRMTKRSAEVVRLRFSNGQQVVCTPSHRFLVDHPDEWRYASDLAGSEVLCSQPSFLKQSKSFVESATIAAVSISRTRARDFTGWFGSLLTARSRAAAMSTTSMAIGPTTGLKTLSCFPPPITSAAGTARQTASAGSELSTRPARRLMFGMGAKLAGLGTATIMKLTCAQSWSSAFRLSAKSAAVTIWSLLRMPISGSSAVAPARRVLCVSVERLSEPADVYCITVPSTERFALAGGMIVSNCRYACMSRPWSPDPRPKEKPQRDRYDRRRDDDEDADAWKVV